MTERIDHTNYEAWLLDRAEGNLDPGQEAALEAFLLANPHLEIEQDELPTVSSEDPSLRPLEKDELHRTLPPSGPPTHANIEDYLIASLEGDLSNEQRVALGAFLEANGKYERMEKLYALGRVERVPWTPVKFNELYRQLPPSGMPDRSRLDDFLVARLEGDLDLEQEAALEQLLLNDAEAQRSWKLTQASKLPGELLPFPDKGSLKKGGKVIALHRPQWTAGLRVAAMVALLFSVTVWYMLREPRVDTRLVVNPVMTDTLPVVDVGSDGLRPGSDASEMASKPGPGSADLMGPGTAPGSTNVKGSVRSIPSDRKGDSDEPIVREQIPLMASVEVEPTSRGVGPRSLLPAGPGPAVDLAPEGDAYAYSEDEGVRWSAFLVGKLRKEVLDSEDTRPLDMDDAVAFVDKGLRSAGAGHAGLSLEKDGQGGIRRFDLRLGRNLEIAARR